MRIQPHGAFALAVLLALTLLSAGQPADPVAPLLQKIKAVGKEGEGSVAAAQALKQLTQKGPAALIATLAALDDANPVAANYLRAAVETITDKALAAGQKLPAAELKAFVLDTKHAGPARKLAFDLLVRVDPKTETQLLPGMLNDPGVELRREAVARLLKEAQTKFDAKDENAKAAYEQALKHARDKDQVELVVDRLKTFGVDVDLTKHFGFITDWTIVGPFDSTGAKGYDTLFPPEQKVDLSAAYTGKGGKKLQWQKHTTKAKMGLVDFNVAIGDLHGVCAFAYTVVNSKKERPVEVRVASNNAVQIFLNGQKIFGRNEYHHGMHMDQHVGKATLKAGANQVLVKVCQNEQTDSWAQQWSFQLRITDDLGTPVPLTVVLNE